MILHELLRYIHLDAMVCVRVDGKLYRSECQKMFEEPIFSVESGLVDPFDKLGGREVSVVDASIREDADGCPVPEIEITLEDSDEAW